MKYKPCYFFLIAPVSRKHVNAPSPLFLSLVCSPFFFFSLSPSHPLPFFFSFYSSTLSVLVAVTFARARVGREKERELLMSTLCFYVFYFSLSSFSFLENFNVSEIAKCILPPSLLCHFCLSLSLSPSIFPAENAGVDTPAPTLTSIRRSSHFASEWASDERRKFIVDYLIVARATLNSCGANSIQYSRNANIYFSARFLQKNANVRMTDSIAGSSHPSHHRFLRFTSLPLPCELNTLNPTIFTRK